MPRNIHLLVIDPQNDFCDPGGSLYVPGAERDMDRLALLVHRLRDKLADVHITLDSHRKVDIAHPIWFVDSDGHHPDPFTSITAADMTGGAWTTTVPAFRDRTLAYLRALETGGRYPHVIWPYHCLIGSGGHAVWPRLFEAVAEWEERFATPDIVTKGSNPFTEHFSAVRAEVPDPEDPTTQLNAGLIATLEDADVVLLAGEARSHCLANTVRDITSALTDPGTIEKLILLTDATSDVPGFEALGDSFVRDLCARGLKTSTTDRFLAAA